MALRESAAVDQFERLIGQLEEPDGVNEVAAASAEPACEVGPGDVEVVEERRDCVGLLTGGRALFERC